ncbi:iron-containing redox enzyme family protein [Aliikangiella coralliicola]|nr:iron-containing redox enzyme family protein [Aliikangiella coralliicola]
MENVEASKEMNNNNKEKKENIRYLIPESEYDYDHPEVIRWTKYFTEKAQKRNVFINIRATLENQRTCSNRSMIAAQTMASAWYDFTCYVPVFITKAVTMTDDPERQHHLIQIAYDELGGRDKNFIHSNLFLEAIEEIGVNRVDGPSTSSIKEILDVLDKTLVNTKSQAGIVGLLLSFEIIAEENIEMLFDCLCHDESSSEILSKSPFFKIHRADETEHIRHSVANFLRFCNTDDDRGEFEESFDAGIDYWHRFWDQNARLINIASSMKASA